MTEDLRTEDSVTIEAPLVRVWEALTTPELIKRWFFGVDTTTDWNVGSPIVHRGEYQGRPYEARGPSSRSSLHADSFTVTGARSRAYRMPRRTTSGSRGSSQNMMAGRSSGSGTSICLPRRPR